MTVKQRQVFYIHGFDPRGARHYHRLYRNQAEKQTTVNGIEIQVGPRQRNSHYHQTWPLTTADTHSQYHFLGWDDIVRQHWSQGWWQVLKDFYYTFILYILSGNLLKFAKASRQQLLAGLYPFMYLLVGLTASSTLAYYGAGASYRLFFASSLPPTASLALALVLGLMILLFSLYGVKKLGDKLAVFWLQRIYAFAGKWAQDALPELETRSQQFAQHIINAIEDTDNDEIVIIAHSVGTMLVIPTLAKVLAALPQSPTFAKYFANKRVVLITLGQCIPLVSFLPKATHFRSQLQELAQASRLTWLDYTAPTDGACFPLLDPITSCGLTRHPNAGPKILSPRFFTLYYAPHYKKLRRAWYTMHFLYLMATDKAGAYDFFAFTAGPKRIVDQITPSLGRDKP